MSKKGIIAVLSAVVLMVVASISLVLAIGHNVSADSEPVITVKDREYFEIGDDNILRGFSESGIIQARNATWLNIEIPAGVVEIQPDVGDDNFAPMMSVFSRRGEDCAAKVVKVSLPEVLQVIGDMAFAKCSNLQAITLPDAVLTLGNYAFYGCDQLETIVIPSTVTTIGSGLFESCENLKRIIVEDPALKTNPNLLPYSSIVFDDECTVTFNANGGTPVDEQVINYNSTVTKPADPTREGYTFKGWKLNDSDYEWSTPVTGNITLTAEWEIKKYTVSFNTNGGSAVAPQTVEHGNVASVPTSTKEGYGVKYWYTTNENEAYDFTTPVTQDIILTAKWVVAYTVQFDVPQGSTVSDQLVNEGENATMPVPTREGYAFEYWYTDDESVPFNFEQTAINDNVTLHAKWIKTYVVMFNTNGGDELDNQIVKAGERVLKETPTRKGHTFVGWYKDAEYQEAYDFTTAVTSDFTLHAKWEANFKVDTNIVIAVAIGVASLVIGTIILVVIIKKHKD